MKIPKQFRLSLEAVAILDEQANATQFVEDLILGRLVAQPPWLDLEKRIDDLQEALNILTASKTQDAPPPDKLGPLCCLQDKLCKHWVWNMDEGVNINSITGEIKDGQL